MSNSIWKTPDQKPTSGKCVCIYDGFEYYVDTANPDCWDGMFIEKWCYFHDLIAQADKAERLQKAVDFALRQFTELMNSFVEEDEVAIEIAVALTRIKQLIKGGN